MSTDYVGDIDVIGIHVITNDTGIDQGTLDNDAAAIFWETQSYFTSLNIDGHNRTDFLNNTGPYDVYVFSDITLKGGFWCVSCGHVTVTVDGIALGTFSLNNDGNFTATFVIPELSNGNHVIKVNDCSKTWTFNITVNPTLIVTPESGPVGTVITVTAYGFDPENVYYLYWAGLCATEEDSGLTGYNARVWIANATVGSNGKFNMSEPITYVVPHVVGGYHDVEAWVDVNWTQVALDGYNYTILPNWELWPGAGYEYAEDQFYVTPTITVNPSTFANDGTTFWVNGTGFDPQLAYTINVDNNAYSVPNFGYEFEFYDWGWVYNPSGSVVASDLCGDLSIQLVKAGFRPGLHVVSLTASNYNDYWDMGEDPRTGFWAIPTDIVDWGMGFFPVDVYATFTVTTEGDAVVDSFNTTLTSLNAHITSIENDIATLTTDVGTLQVSVSSLDAKVTNVQNGIATVQTTLGTMTGTLTGISGDMATVKTQVGTINAKVASFLPVDMMPVWIAVIFAIIAAIASIYGVLVIRSKIAQ